MEYKIAIVGLGYVGLPLAVESGKKYKTIGFDINEVRIKELNSRYDRTGEVSTEELAESKHLSLASNPDAIKDANFYIITVPTPVDQHKNPDLTPLIKASESVGKHLKSGDIVVYESTVYPGCTEEICVPILEKLSGFTHNLDFFTGYSPERINPGDKYHRLVTIKKVTSGSTSEIAQKVDQFYKSIIQAGTYIASSIRVAEAAKVIENSQRDLNIAFVNELSVIFERMGLDTLEVLEAAGTKWNFLPFRPGLVGGHCIGVDPYYLTYKAEEIGYKPEVILAGRRINDGMGSHVAHLTIKLMGHKGVLSSKNRILILGFTFKENCGDVRNTRVIDIIHELETYGASVDTHDPTASFEEVQHEYGIELVEKPNYSVYTAIILAVNHEVFGSFDWEKIREIVPVIVDVKGALPRHLSDKRL